MGPQIPESLTNLTQTDELFVSVVVLRQKPMRWGLEPTIPGPSTTFNRWIRAERIERWEVAASAQIGLGRLEAVVTKVLKILCRVVAVRVGVFQFHRREMSGVTT